MFVNNPDQYMLPSYRISPFKTDFISINHRLPADDYADSYLNERFGQGKYQFTINGREGMRIVFSQFDLKPDDVVTILTTTQNFYISSCVTKTIENFCKWNRELTPETTVLFVNHEFGYPYPEMEKLVALGLPIIEDCCTTFFSQDKDKKTGTYGKFTIYSFPKFFPIQIGGMIVKNDPEAVLEDSKISNEEIRYIKNVLSHHLRNESALLEGRRSNYDYMLSLFSAHGFTERVSKDELVYPTSFLFNVNGLIKNLPNLKEFLYARGMQCSVFYGEDAFFVPCHQNMDKADIEYIFNCVLNYMKTESA